MQTELVQVEKRPMLFVTRRTTMDPQAIAQTMGEAFAVLGRFIGEKHVPAAGPPLAVYSGEKDGSMRIDVGFPVAEATLVLAGGEVKAGTTPSGTARRTVHLGPYDQLRNTYGEVEAKLRKEGKALPAYSWEVYLNEPGKVPDSELQTEIYLPGS